MTVVHEKQSRSERPHPYLHGNFAPIHRVQPLTACSYTGSIPEELAGGEYVRNGGNPVTNEDLGRDAHWFDGDGMLSGVAFRRRKDGSIQPEFVNQYILTDAYLSTVTTSSLRLPILPSIATLVNPASSLLTIILRIFRTIFLVILSNLAGSRQRIKKISVANTGILYHDGRALATCESGPPMRVSLPGLETVGWYDGCKAEGESVQEEVPEGRFGGDGLLSFMKEWTTAHPRIDPITAELILFHSTFVAPYVHYSIIPSTQNSPISPQPRLVNAAVPGIKSAKMMHDFGVSLTNTIIMDLGTWQEMNQLCLTIHQDAHGSVSSQDGSQKPFGGLRRILVAFSIQQIHGMRRLKIRLPTLWRQQQSICLHAASQVLPWFLALVMSQLPYPKQLQLLTQQKKSNADSTTTASHCPTPQTP